MLLSEHRHAVFVLRDALACPALLEILVHILQLYPALLTSLHSANVPLRRVHYVIGHSIVEDADFRNVNAHRVFVRLVAKVQEDEDEGVVDRDGKVGEKSRVIVNGLLLRSG